MGHVGEHGHSCHRSRGFDRETTRSEIAEILKTFPKECPHNDVGLGVSPLEDIDTWAPNVKDKRRIGMISIYGCLKEQPLDCTYTMRDNSATDFDIGSLKRILGRCSEALARDIRNGSELAEWVSKDAPNRLPKDGTSAESKPVVGNEPAKP